jgi:hypothetical protein|tara:strand:- start:2429 stop:2746 length:318 start_codon:yes stop_codon:yes gene_type:complete
MSKYKLYQWCPIQEKVVPVEEVMVRVHANAAHNFIHDEMPPTRNPLNPKEIYTSKSKLRAAYRAAGAIEVGDSYDRGYSPEKESSSREKAVVANFMKQVRDRANG